MEVAATRHELVLSERAGTNLVQLIWDRDTKAYYIHHRRQGKRLLWEFASEDLQEATRQFRNFIEQVIKVFP